MACHGGSSCQGGTWCLLFSGYLSFFPLPTRKRSVFSVRRLDQRHCEGGAALKIDARATLSLFLHPSLVSRDEVEHANRGQGVFPIQDENVAHPAYGFPAPMPGAASTTPRRRVAASAQPLGGIPSRRRRCRRGSPRGRRTGAPGCSPR